MFKGDRLRALRKQKHLTQTELGEMLGLDKSTICCYEKETRQPPLENIIDFMQIFNVTADYLLGVDHLIKVVEDEIKFIEELRKDKNVYDILLENPKRGADLIKHRLN